MPDRTLILSLLFFLCSLLGPYSLADTLELDTLPQNTRYYFQVENLSDPSDNFIQNNQDGFFPPASTQKLLTALAAKLELEPDFHYRTELSKKADHWYLHFSGDPTLSRQDLLTLLTQAKEQGLTHIKGNLYIDDTHFSGLGNAVGSPWDALGVCYSAPSQATNLDHNCIPGALYTSASGKTRVNVPKQYPIYVDNQAVTVTSSVKKQQHCELHLQATNDNHYVLSGCIVEREKPLPLNFAVRNTSLYTTQVIYQQLNQLGITLDGQVLTAPRPKDSELIAQHQSQPLDDLLKVMLRKSDNLIADSMTKTLGQKFFFQPGNFDNGTEAIKQILLSKAGIDLTHAQIVDGSGLSRSNRLTAGMLLDVLRYIGQHDKTLNFVTLLPRSGQSGTLKYRRSMLASPVKGNIAAKSGTLYGTKNMAGFALNEQGEPTRIFLQLVSDYFPEKDRKTSPLTQVERRFYPLVVQRDMALAQQRPHQ
ncbi:MULTISPECIES: D-alanyl-D-alanine carboxypeptidase/D-alanyl-D-alanine-endopeptidase [unclassified Vibrio]|uniref:D-alanyl-D-alanine carboxypeptidase/D-alanyl-D-alanine-endopeptidase n=1 Tax=Vibrio sp. HB236076 TaxID=3232307 RepID=A0AB39HB74_9VIBR|nr:D-alanyl-D-alanine carboxypeptidase/D-alanyl-D-alanine-endopeptidase [Vibrio sp. HB161653]MDP5254040.1 D-alanyl-D-alanine carboxypeptidase/D-alanyl-D-alanine-endopeptidase [Vibrio sp. HB161653]